jgi:hypothetical protein
MSHRKLLALAGLSVGLFVLVAASDGLGQPDGPGFGKKGFGPGGPGGETRKILKDFDKDGDGRLNAEERATAREAIKKQGNGFGGFGGPKGKGGFGPPGMGKMDPPKPGPQVKPEEVASYLDPWPRR